MESALRHACAVMSGFDAPWGIAGGWALDMFLGVESRPHGDVDVSILRRDQQLLRPRFEGALVSKVVDHRLSPWKAQEFLASPVHEVHATWPDGTHLEFLLNESDPESREWVFRRDHRIRRALTAAFNNTRGVPYLAPELVLLYKSKAPSPKDEADFDAVRPRLSGEQRAWLVQALAICAPSHHWATNLTERSESD